MALSEAAGLLQYQLGAAISNKLPLTAALNLFIFFCRIFPVLHLHCVLSCNSLLILIMFHGGQGQAVYMPIACKLFQHANHPVVIGMLTSDLS